MARTIPDTIRALCLSFPESEEVISHGAPDFKVRGKSFATFCLNFHGDGRVALWLRSPEGVQRLYTELNPTAYFVPPYVGPRGWLGMELNKGLSWQEVTARVREAWENAGPASLVAHPGSFPVVEPPDQPMSPEEIDPMLAEPARSRVRRLAEKCQHYPETSQTTQFGSPVWKAGKKTYACAHHRNGHLQFQFRVGIAQQGMLISDDRYRIPPYIGQNGWIDLDVSTAVNWAEIDHLLDTSYRHFALKRMLKQLDTSSN